MYTTKAGRDASVGGGSEEPAGTTKKERPEYLRAGDDLRALEEILILTAMSYQVITPELAEGSVFLDGRWDFVEIWSALHRLEADGSLVRLQLPESAGTRWGREAYAATVRGAMRWESRHGEAAWKTGFAVGAAAVPEDEVPRMLMITQVRMAIDRAAWSLGMRISMPMSTVAWNDLEMYYEWPRRTGGMARAQFAPAGTMIVQTQSGPRHFMLEVDTGGPGFGDWGQRLHCELGFYACGDYQAVTDSDDLRILVVTTERERLNELMTFTEERTGWQRLWFSHLDALADDPLADFIWWVNGVGGPMALMSECHD